MEIIEPPKINDFVVVVVDSSSPLRTQVLNSIIMQISSRNLDRVRKLKSAMTRLTARVQKV